MEYELTKRQLYDLEMIMNGGFSPLVGFLNQNDYESVVNNMRLEDGKLWPIPITLDVVNVVNNINIGDTIILVDSFKNKLAHMIIESIYKPDKYQEAGKVFGTTDDTHPAVNYLFNKVGGWYIGGKVIKIRDPIHSNFLSIRRSPSDLKQHFKDNNIKNVIGFQTRNPMHKSHYTMTRLALDRIPKSHLLIHPVVGMTKYGDINYPTRVKCYKKIMSKYEKDQATLSLLPLAMRMAGPREALWHALIRKNYGCTHFIVGRDHAGPGKNKDGVDFYGPYEAQQLCISYSNEIGLEILTFKEIGYIKELDKYSELTDDIKESGYTILNISGTQLRQKLSNDDTIPEWFAFSDVVDILRKDLGLTILLTGLSGAGKSTIAYYLQEKLLEIYSKRVTILDGDEVRTNLSKGLGFSKEDRDTNVKRIAYVASLISKNGGICIVPCIAPYNETRKYFREICEKHGKYIEIYVSTTLETCEERDVKGLYKAARNGNIKNFTGIDDPYEIPTNSDIIINTLEHDIRETVDIIIKHILNNESR